MQLIVNIKMDNAAFGEDAAGIETARILRRAAEWAEQVLIGIPCDLEGREQSLADLNGNGVGFVAVVPGAAFSYSTKPEDAGKLNYGEVKLRTRALTNAERIWVDQQYAVYQAADRKVVEDEFRAWAAYGAALNRRGVVGTLAGYRKIVEAGDES